MRPLKTAARILVLLLLAGCASAPTAERKTTGGGSEPAVNAAEASPAEKHVAAPLVAEDIDLFSEGIDLLSRSDPPDPAKARSAFASLLQRDPGSRWRSAAEAFIRLIDETEALREGNRRGRLLLENTQVEQSRLLQENEHLRKAIRDLTERLQAETAALIQENDKLKKDLQSLKTLEIELQKRERMIR